MANSLGEAFQDLAKAQQDFAAAQAAYQKAADNQRVLKRTKDALLVSISNDEDKIIQLKRKLKDEDDAKVKQQILKEISDLENDIARLKKLLASTEDELTLAPLYIKFALEDLQKAAAEVTRALGEVSQQIALLHR